MDKRELIERALEGLADKAFYHGGLASGYVYGRFIDALAEQAIVIECEVEHYTPIISRSRPYATIHMEDDEGELHSISLDGLDGREGKAIAIILPLEKEVTEDIDWLDGEDYGAK